MCIIKLPRWKDGRGSINDGRLFLQHELRLSNAILRFLHGKTHPVPRDIQNICSPRGQCPPQPKCSLPCYKKKREVKSFSRNVNLNASYGVKSSPLRSPSFSDFSLAWASNQFSRFSSDPSVSSNWIQSETLQYLWDITLVTSHKPNQSNMYHLRLCGRLEAPFSRLFCRKCQSRWVL